MESSSQNKADKSASNSLNPSIFEGLVTLCAPDAVCFSRHIPHASGRILAERFYVIGTLRSNFLLHKKSVSGLSPETDFFIAYFFLIKYQIFLPPKRFFTKTTIATIAARRIITNGRIGVLSPVLTAVLAVEFDEPDV
nr:hypothetical protein [Blautia obeum]